MKRKIKKLMNKGFWENIDKPFMALAPMADVTDAAFRRLFAKYGRPDVTWTEFVSADGLFLAPEEDQRDIWLPDDLRETATEHGVAPNNPLLKDLIYTEGERPIVAQFFSRDPERMGRAARLAEALGYDGVDINMGCPARVIVKQGAGCAMIREPEVAQAVIEASQEATSLPVSVKTRVGFYKDEELEGWLKALLATKPVLITLHARTRKDMSDVPARWENIKRAVEIRDQIKPEVLIAGNGDVASLEAARQRVQETDCEGVMVGRGVFGNPWFFSGRTPSLEEKLQVMVEHSYLFDELLGDTKSFAIMKKHLKAYVSDFPGAKDLRTTLMEEANTPENVERIVEDWLAVHK